MAEPESESFPRNHAEPSRIEDQLRILAGAGEILSASLDYDSALERVAHLAVPTLADRCVVDLLVKDGLLHRLVFVHRDPDIVETAAVLRRPLGLISTCEGEPLS